MVSKGKRRMAKLAIGLTDRACSLRGPLVPAVQETENTGLQLRREAEYSGLGGWIWRSSGWAQWRNCPQWSDSEILE